MKIGIIFLCLFFFPIIQSSAVYHNPVQQTVIIPTGRTIIGDALSEEKINELPAKIVMINAFSMCIYEITNLQFAAWLTQSLNNKVISYSSEGKNKGLIVDQQGNLLYKTFANDSNSQIFTQTLHDNNVSFFPVPGKDHYPVINVSWYGAQAYCKDNNCRLPTEAEWEKAAGMEKEQFNIPLKKFRYGCSLNYIDLTSVNFKDNNEPYHYQQVLTKPVGFYNSINFLPIDILYKTPQKTQDAKSPYGAYDMSGNVWEWVSDWYDDDYYKNMDMSNPQGPSSGSKKVVKGGCYDSLMQGVRVAERLGLSPEHCDIYTGFRIVVSIN